MGGAPVKIEHTNLGLATSDDGVKWEVAPEPCFTMRDDEIMRAYDPRLTLLDGRAYMCFAVDTRHGLRGGIAVTDDFENFEVLSLSVPDNRNMVLFPEKIGGMYVRLERPFPVYSRGGGDRFDMWLSDSPDLKYWGGSDLVMGVEHVPFANDKIGPAAPPVRTEKGWPDDVSCGGSGPVAREERLGEGVEEALLRRNHAAGSGRPAQGGGHLPRSFDCARGNRMRRTAGSATM